MNLQNNLNQIQDNIQNNINKTDNIINELQIVDQKIRKSTKILSNIMKQLDKTNTKNL